ncbi:MAG TPA: pyridoxal 5'-phosphate synthase glutaminase subunit PdxT [Ktedonobacterales bacterium]|nr:pyridoxal 5'-phosphate synthase glutaminase subunit PdxT [Ktedonobacterales bacterium]
MTRIGVLALQGDFREHARAVGRLGAEARAVRLPRDLAGLDGLIIPGGESTVMGKLMVEYQLDQPLRDVIHAGLPTWGTCAGLILLARETDNALLGQPLLAAMDIRVCRNAFGAQRESFETNLVIPALGERPFHAVFIRGPIVESVGASVEILARLEAPLPSMTASDTAQGADIVAVRQGSLLGTAFHPEVTDDLRFHDYFLTIVRGASVGVA